MRQTAQKKIKVSKDKESSECEYFVNNNTDESTYRSQNEDAKCLYYDKLFFEDIHGEKLMQYVPCRRWTHEESAGIEGNHFVTEYYFDYIQH